MFIVVFAKQRDSGFNFIVEIDNVTVAGFSEAGGLNVESDIVEYKTGMDGVTKKLPGLVKFSNITLKRGYTATTDLWDWRKAVTDGTTDRKSGAIILHDEARVPAIRWNFQEGWPNKLEGPALNAKTSDVAIESLEIAHEGLTMELA